MVPLESIRNVTTYQIRLKYTKMQTRIAAFLVKFPSRLGWKRLHISDFNELKTW